MWKVWALESSRFQSGICPQIPGAFGSGGTLGQDTEPPWALVSSSVGSRGERSPCRDKGEGVLGVWWVMYKGPNVTSGQEQALDKLLYYLLFISSNLPAGLRFDPPQSWSGLSCPNEVTEEAEATFPWLPWAVGWAGSTRLMGRCVPEAALFISVTRALKKNCCKCQLFFFFFKIT